MKFYFLQEKNYLLKKYWEEIQCHINTGLFSKVETMYILPFLFCLSLASFCNGKT